MGMGMGMGMTGSTYPGGMMGNGLLSSGPPPVMTSPEEQLRWYEQFFQLQCGMAPSSAPSMYYNQPGYAPSGLNNSYNPYASSAAPFPSSIGADSLPSYSYPGSGQYDSFLSPASQYSMPGLPGYYPPSATSSATGAGLGVGNSSGTGAGGTTSTSTSQSGEYNNYMPNYPSNKQTTAEQRASALAALMNPQSNAIDYTSVSTSRYNGPLSSNSTQAFPSQPIPISSNGGAADRGMGLLSDAVSSLPHSTSGTPDATAGHVSSDSESDRDRTSHLLAAASTMLSSTAHLQQQQLKGDEVKANLVEPDAHAVAEEAEDEPDWREQLYYWIGVLYYDPGRRQQVWKGSWVGSYTGKPSPEEFSASSNHFEYFMPSRSGHPLMRPDGGLAPQSGHWQGHYLMDNTGDGTWEKYMDTEYEVLFEPTVMPDGNEKFCVYGRGDSEFGAFVVTGRFCQHSRVLEMTRQYISDEDVRASLNLSQFAQYCKQQQQP